MPTKALQFRVPVVSGVSQSGSLITYAPDTEVLFRRSALYVDRLLRGAAPADLPVQLSTKFLLEINLKVAKALGIEMPHSLLSQVDEIIDEIFYWPIETSSGSAQWSTL